LGTKTGFAPALSGGGSVLVLFSKVEPHISLPIALNSVIRFREFQVNNTKAFTEKGGRFLW
jgi:hypothetical protein